MTQEQLNGAFSSASDEWETPQSFFDSYDAIYHFTLDAASADDNAKCERHFTRAEDGLSRDWGGEIVWLNPPYGRTIAAWVKKAMEEGQKPNTTVVCLLPARTDTAWFHDYCSHGHIRFIRGRLRFNNSKYNAPFPSMIVIFGGSY